jgi:hypothetical protein
MNVLDDKVVIATHGRGIFTATLDQPISRVVVSPLIVDYGILAEQRIGFVDLIAKFKLRFDDCQRCQVFE